jgi:SAM-dependent methyltransferase|tara:strand:+ start:191 stop:895 length:705 start_codon:yes stop_codon:yes gene_type:complete
MYRRLKVFLRQQLDILKSLNFFDLFSFHLSFLKIKKKLKVLLEIEYRQDNGYSDVTAQEKYLNYKFWSKESLLRAFKLDLHSSVNKKNILDIGTGAGYFPFICKELGHEGFCIDVPGNDLYDQITDSLSLVKYKRLIKSFEPLSLKTDERFDLITAYMICFNNHKQKDLWGSEQWRFFISDLQSNYLKENGKIVLNFNEEEPGFYFSSELKSYFRQENYIIEDNTILIQSSPRG